MTHLDSTLSHLELILTAALSLACQMDAEAIQAWPSIADDCRDAANTPRETCLFDVADCAMDLASQGIEPDPLALLAGWVDWEVEELALDILTA